MYRLLLTGFCRGLRLSMRSSGCLGKRGTALSALGSEKSSRSTIEGSGVRVGSSCGECIGGSSLLHILCSGEAGGDCMTGKLYCSCDSCLNLTGVDAACSSMVTSAAAACSFFCCCCSCEKSCSVSAGGVGQEGELPGAVKMCLRCSAIGALRSAICAESDVTELVLE